MKRGGKGGGGREGRNTTDKHIPKFGLIWPE